MKKEIEISNFEKYLIFRKINKSDIDIFKKKISLSSYGKKEIIIKEDDTGKSILFLIKGSISISQALTLKTNQYNYNDNREKELIRVNSEKINFTFGEISLFNKDKKRTATVKATSDCLIGELTFDDLFKICESNNSVGYQIMKNISELITKQLIQSNDNVLKLTTAFSLMVEK